MILSYCYEMDVCNLFENILKILVCMHGLTKLHHTLQVLSNTIKQKRKEKAGKWEVPLPKVLLVWVHCDCFSAVEGLV